MKALPMSHPTVRKLLATGVAAFFALTAPALAWCTVADGQSSPPSLAELARKEAERRKTSKEAKAKKVITTKDMPESARRPASTPATTDGAAPPHATAHPPAAPGSPGSPGSNDQKPAAGAETAQADDKAEAAWRSRITLAREGLRRNEVFLQALQTRVNALTVDYANSDANGQIRVRENQAKALEEMERVKADIEQSKKQIGDIEEEARRAGVPPGWLR
jgi:hypothetical protein